MRVVRSRMRYAQRIRLRKTKKTQQQQQNKQNKKLYLSMIHYLCAHQCSCLNGILTHEHFSPSTCILITRFQRDQLT